MQELGIDNILATSFCHLPQDLPDSSWNSRSFFKFVRSMVLDVYGSKVFPRYANGFSGDTGEFVRRRISARYGLNWNTYELGKALGLSELEMELIRQKKKLIEKLRKAREQQGLSQAQLAEKVSSKQPAIARMESGQVSEVSLDFLCKVALALEVPFTIKAKAA